MEYTQALLLLRNFNVTPPRDTLLCPFMNPSLNMRSLDLFDQEVRNKKEILQLYFA